MVAKEGLFSLYDIALFCETRDIVGDFVECGVWKGGYIYTRFTFDCTFSNKSINTFLTTSDFPI